MNNYSYEDVKKACEAIIKVGKVKLSCGGIAVLETLRVSQQHSENLEKLDGSAKELYIKLIEDGSINY